MSCGSCRVKFTSREQTISCEGHCGNQFHPACCHVPSDAIKLLGKISGLSWQCEKCLAVSTKFKPDTLKQVFEQKINEVVKEMENIVIKMRSDITQIATEKLEEVNIQLKKEYVLLAESKANELSFPSTSSITTKTTDNNLYSTALKSKSSVIIKPKNPNQKNYETKSDILHNIDPVKSDINISSVKNIKDGGIVLGCSNENELVKFKTLANSKLSERYEVKDLRSVNPRIRVVGMSEKLKDEVLVNYVKYQNKNLFNLEKPECKVLKIWHTKKNNCVFQAILQVDVNSYNNIMSIGNGKLFIGLDVCDVYDSVVLRRCFKCNGYNHHSGNCQIDKHYCPRCAEQHLLKDCKVSDGNLQCINCIKFNEKNKDSIVDIKHAAWDSKCHVYRQNVEEFKSKLYI